MTDLASYRKLAAEIGCGDSELMPRIFATIADQDEATVADRHDNRFEVKHAICNCDAVVCTNWRPHPEFAAAFVAPSRFAAVLSAEACSVCDVCIDRCSFDAITLEEVRPPDSIPA